MTQGLDACKPRVNALFLLKKSGMLRQGLRDLISRRMDATKTMRIRTDYLFVAVLVTAAVARLLFLTDHSLWVDELFSLKYAHLSLRELLAETAANDNHPPLYYALLHFWVQAFGDSEFAVRSLSAVFGILTVAFVYRLGVVLYGERVGLLAAAVLALSKFSIYYSQEARMYTLLPLLATVSVYYFWKLLHKPGWRNALLYVAATVLLLYTQSYGVFLVVAENGYLLGLWLLGIHRDLALKPGRWVALQLGVLALFLPWVTVIAGGMARLEVEGFWLTRPTLMTVAGTFSEFSGSQPLLRILLVLLIALSAVSAVALLLRAGGKDERRQAFLSADFLATTLLFACLLVPVVLPFLVSQYSTPIYVNRAIGVGYFAFCLLVAKGLPSIKPRPVYFSMIAAIIGLSLQALAVEGYVHGDQWKNRELAAYVARNVAPRAFIVTCDDGHMSWPFAHYARAAGLRNRFAEVNDSRIGTDSWRLAKGEPELWLITLEGRHESMEACRKLPELLRQNYGSMTTWEVPLQGFGIRVYKHPL